MPSLLPPRLDFNQALSCLASGGILVYPTETFFAIGCLAKMADAVQAIHAIKGRPDGKALPMLAASLDQVESFSGPLPSDLRDLVAKFWPGPLTMLLPVRPAILPLLATQLAPDSGNGPRMAVRVTANPMAARLAGLAGCPLVSTSANLYGQPPACILDEPGGQGDGCLDEAFLQAVARQTAHPCGILAPKSSQETPCGGLPSTIVEMPGQTFAGSPDIVKSGKLRLRIVREGAISRQELCART